LEEAALELERRARGWLESDEARFPARHPQGGTNSAVGFRKSP